MKARFTLLFAGLAVLGIVSQLGVETARAAVLTWNDGSGDSVWSNASGSLDWSGLPWTDGSNAVFAGTGIGTVALGTPISANNVTFDAAGYTIGASGGTKSLTVASSITSNVNGTTTISAPVVLSGGPVFTVAASSTLALNGNLTRPAGTSLSFANAGTITLHTINGTPVDTVVANNNGILGGWAIQGEQFATYSNGNVSAYTQEYNVSGGSTLANALPTSNVMANVGNTNSNLEQTITGGSVTINSLIEQDDVHLESGAMLTLASGGLIFSGGNSWFQSSDGSGLLTSGLSNGNGGNDLIVTVNNASYGDMEIHNVGIVNNGATSVTLIKSGSGKLQLNTSTSTYTGGTVVNGGMLQASSDTSLGAVPAAEQVNLTLNNGSQFFNDGSILTLSSNRDIRLGPGTQYIEGGWGGMTVNGQITGPGSLAVAWDGPVTLNQASSYQGSTTIGTTKGSNYYYYGSATLVLGASGALPAGTDLTFGSDSPIGATATLDLNGYNATVRTLNGRRNAVVGNSAGGGSASTLTVGANGASSTFGGTIQDGNGQTSLVLVGGVLNLTGANTYSGGTTIGGGTLNVNSDAALGGASGAVTFTNNASLQFGANNVSLNSSRTISINSGVTATFDTNGNAATIQGAITGSGSLTKIGAGVLGINNSGASSYTGATTVLGGTLVVTGGFTATSGISVASGAAFGGDGATAGVTLASSATLAPGFTATNPFQVGDLQPATLTTAAGSVLAFKLSNSASAGNDEITVAGNMSIANGTIINVATLLNGSLQANSVYPLIVASDNTLPIGSLTLTGLPVNTRQTYSLVASLTAVNLDVVGSAASLVWQGGASGNPNAWDLKVTKNWSNAGVADIFYNLDSVTFNDSGAAFGSVNVSTNVQPALVSFSTTSATSSYTLSGTGAIVGGAQVSVSGAGPVTINNANSYTGGTTLYQGLLNLGNSAAIGSGLLTINGGSLDNTSGLPMTLAANNAQTWNANFPFNGSQSLNLGTGAVTLGSSLTVTVKANTLTVGGAISDGGANYSLTKDGSGTLVLAGGNTYGGGTTLQNGTLALDNTGALGTGPLTINGGALDNTGSSAITLANSNAQNWNANFAFIGSQSLNLGSGTVTLSPSSGTNVTVTANANNLTVGGPISDNSAGYSLTKAGTGTLTLGNQQSSYSGGTTITGGTLVVMGGGYNASPAGSGPVVVGSGTTFLGGANDCLGWGNNSAGGVTIEEGGQIVSGAGIRISMDRNLTVIGGTIGSVDAGDAYGSYSFRNDNGASHGTPGATYTFTSAPDGRPSVISATDAALDDSLVAFDVVRGGGPVDLLISGTISQTHPYSSDALEIDGNGVTVISGITTYIDGTIVTGGTVELANPAVLLTGTSLTVGDNASALTAFVGTEVSAPRVAAVPEPGTLALLAAGVAAVAVAIRRRNRALARSI